MKSGRVEPVHAPNNELTSANVKMIPNPPAVVQPIATNSHSGLTSIIIDPPEPKLVNGSLSTIVRPLQRYSSERSSLSVDVPIPLAPISQVTGQSRSPGILSRNLSARFDLRSTSRTDRHDRNSIATATLGNTDNVNRFGWLQVPWKSSDSWRSRSVIFGDEEGMALESELAQKQNNMVYKKRVTLLCVILALAGFALTVVENELSLALRVVPANSSQSPSITLPKDNNQISEQAVFGEGSTDVDKFQYDWDMYKQSLMSYAIKSTIWASAILLDLTVVLYHAIDLRIFMSENDLHSLALALTPSRLLLIATELLICSVVPPPHGFAVWFSTFSVRGVRIEGSMPIDLFISTLMLGRLYWLWRYFLARTKFITGTIPIAMQSIFGFRMNVKFLLKSLMQTHPVKVITLFMLLILLTASWAMRNCEVYYVPAHGDFANTFWLIAITFLTIGYGDTTPQTYCGRAISVLTGMLGASCTAFLIAILARKLYFSQPEESLFTLIKFLELRKMIKNEAAKVIQNAFRLYQMRKQHMTQESKRDLTTPQQPGDEKTSTTDSPGRKQLTAALSTRNDRIARLENWHHGKYLLSARKMRNLSIAMRGLKHNVNLTEVFHIQEEIKVSVDDIGDRMRAIETTIQQLSLAVSTALEQQAAASTVQHPALRFLPRKSASSFSVLPVHSLKAE